jgi:hypothetical protein
MLLLQIPSADIERLLCRSEPFTIEGAGGIFFITIGVKSDVPPVYVEVPDAA